MSTVTYLPGRAQDRWTLYRRPTGPDGADADGIPLGEVEYASGWGTCQEVGARARAVAAQAGQEHDAVLVTTARDFTPGDRLVCRGETWRVVAVQDVRVHARVMLMRGPSDRRAA